MTSDQAKIENKFRQHEHVSLNSLPIEEDYGAQTQLLSDEDKENLFEEDKLDEGYWWYNPVKIFDPNSIQNQFSNDTLQKEFEEKIRNNQFSLLDIPANINEILKIINDSEFSYEDITRLVRQSPVLMADFLKLANSVIYNRSSRLSDIRVVLPRLGVTVVKSVLYLNSAKINLANQPIFKDIATSIVEHSRTVAIIAKYLSQRYYPNSDNAYMAGLLHDIGKLAILKELTVSYQNRMNGNEEFNNDFLASLFSSFHEKVGSLIATSWNLTPEIHQCIAFHHNLPDISECKENELELHLAALIQVSDLMARLLNGTCEQEGISIFQIPAGEIIGLERDVSTIEFLNHVPEIVSSN